MNIHEKFMNRCLELSEKGLGNVAPNPLVGCVIVHENKIIGEGYHQNYGGPHAEVNAINSVKNKKLLEKSTLYVTLEPCSHFGKTPPCADLIIKNKIPHVVIASSDPNPLVSGNGIDKLKKAGIVVETSMLKREYEWINRRFFTFFDKQRPYIILKWAETKDGFIDIERKNNDANINWITNEASRTLVHKWRTEEQAILIGTKTAISDNPTLTSRFWKGKNPLRIVLDRNLILSKQLNVFNHDASTLVFTTSENHTDSKNLNFSQVDFGKNLIPDILKELYDRKIQSIIIEGGAKTLQSFIDADLWDEARIFTGDISFESGVKAPEISGEIFSKQNIGTSKLNILLNKKTE